MKIIEQNIKIGACKNSTIARADDVFTGYIDSDFTHWNLDVKSPKTEETELAVLEITENGTFEDIYKDYDLDKTCMTQAQIIEFVKNHKYKLNHNWYNFFLFKVRGEFFVARVQLFCDVSRYTYVYRFSYDFVWPANFQPHIVVPQLALSNLDPLITSETLTLCPNCGCKLELIVKK